MKKKAWLLPIIILGLSFVVSIVSSRPIGVSTEYSVTSGIIHQMIDPEIISKDENTPHSMNKYYEANQQKIAKAIDQPINYGMLFVISIPFGAWMASKLLRKKQAIHTKKIIYPSFIHHPITLFIGGLLLLFGARWAGGCTSGHMMSGIMQSSVSGILFAGVVFITAIITAKLIEKRGK